MQYSVPPSNAEVAYFSLDSPEDEWFQIKDYYPPGVTNIIASSFSCFISHIDENLVLKYPNIESLEINVQARIHSESQLYTILGNHDRVIKFKGVEEAVILLKYATNGSVAHYLRNTETSLTTAQRLTWAKQAAEGMAYIYSMGVPLFDTNASNLLLDQRLNINIPDFQGRHVSPDGSVILDGLSSETVKSCMPRSDPNHANEKMDIFALGSAIHFIMTGHEPFPDLDPNNDNYEAKTSARYE
ncbi:hypothetical protein VTL71DRAFT_6711 [Oculimacula yallundae]|uniref:Protein kinase domain-containing protein n=1 Tax=Oculimacula yallundae TaxID=86028 RepID=A0ABR4BXR2_9HELO